LFISEFWLKYISAYFFLMLSFPFEKKKDILIPDKDI